MILHQFAISHYCEKIRWALDYKGIDYTFVNYIPGAHVKKIRAIAGDSIVPVLQNNNETIQSSDLILDWLDTNYPQRSLTPADESQKQQVLEWEKFMDREIGIHIRRYLYHYLLEAPDILIPMLTEGRPWYEKMVLKFKYKKVNQLFRKYLNINAMTAEKSRQRFSRAIDKVNDEYSKRSFLVGESFTRADLSAAALVAPLIRAEKYGIDWPSQLPGEISTTEQTLLPKLSWAFSLYENYR